ncbi:MAG: phenylacetate-CoA oxygenase subunit PaaI, partial [Phycisphaerales bacterium]|nr:phenylacetate-CoA oxygenase subunit PaaI [Phycisphaerales bacterium]
MTAMQDMMKDQDANLVLSLADDLLMLGHVQGDWTGLGPILEEDIASSSMSQDDLSHALVLY